MIDLRNAKRVAVIGGGITAWFAALTLKRVFGRRVEVTVVEYPDLDLAWEDEGALPNLAAALHRNDIPVHSLMQETGATYRLGFLYEGWRGGGRQDRYYHLFSASGIEEFDWQVLGGYPLLSALIAVGIDLSAAVPAFEAIAEHASQAEVHALLATGKSGVSPSLHFEGHRLARYLKLVAVQRGVVHRFACVNALIVDERGHAKALQLHDSQLETDFVVDASGRRRIGLGKTYGVRWRSFAEHLPVDRSIRFQLPADFGHPQLVTRAISMKAGWMYQIPLIDRISAGYMFSSRHLDTTRAIAEVQNHLNQEVAPMPVVPLEAGHLEKMWINNVVALGLASGFVEPLAGTAVGQMLEQLRNLERVLLVTRGVVGTQTIEAFNGANAQSWSGIRDFLRMHYDCPRKDTAFWHEIAHAPYPDSYAELKERFRRRTPRDIDFQEYAGNGWRSLFDAIDWMFVAAALRVVLPSAGGAELFALPKESRSRVMAYAERFFGGAMRMRMRYASDRQGGTRTRVMKEDKPKSRKDRTY